MLRLAISICGFLVGTFAANVFSSVWILAEGEALKKTFEVRIYAIFFLFFSTSCFPSRCRL
jgi:hypothetical protein